MSESSSDTILMLIKFGQRTHMEDLQRKGAVFCSPVETFKKSELGEARCDDWEGASQILQPSQLSSFKVGNFEMLPDLVGPIKIAGTEPHRQVFSHIYCMTFVGFKQSHDEIQITSPRLSEFGDTICIFHNPKNFLDTFEKRVNLLGGSNFSFGVIDYVDNDFHGEYGIFKKREMYSWQKEFRIAFYLPSHLGLSVTIQIGSAKKICGIQSVDKFENRIVHHPNGKHEIRF